MMDSMTDGELDGKNKIDESRIKRIARGSGVTILEVKIMLEEYKRFSKIIERMGGLVKGKGADLANIQRNPGQFMNRLNGVLPQNLINSMGGAGGLMNMMKEFSSLEGMEHMAGLRKKGKR
jgi:signal recognition particle subunit SRP54